MVSLSLHELKLVAKSKGIKDYKNKSEDELIKLLSKPKPKINFSKQRIENIRRKFNELRCRFSKSKIKQIRRNLHEKENENLFTPKIKEIEKIFLEFIKNLVELKKYYDYDNIEYKGIRDVRNLFDLSIDEDFYKPISTSSAFDGDYTEYESIGDKENYWLKNFFIKWNHI